MVKMLYLVLVSVFCLYVDDCESADRAYAKPADIRKRTASCSSTSSVEDHFSVDTLIGMHKSCLEYADEMHAKSLIYAKNDSHKSLVQICQRAEEKGRATAELYKKAFTAAQNGEDPSRALQKAFSLGKQDSDSKFLETKKKTKKRRKRDKKSVKKDLADHSDQEELCDLSASLVNLASGDDDAVAGASGGVISDLDFPQDNGEPLAFEEDLLSNSSDSDESYKQGFYDASMGLEMKAFDPAYCEGYLTGLGQTF